MIHLSIYVNLARKGNLLSNIKMADCIGLQEVNEFIGKPVWVIGKLSGTNGITDGNRDVRLTWRDEAAIPGNTSAVVELQGVAKAGNEIEVESVVVFEDSPDINFDIESYQKVLKAYRSTY